MTVLQLHGVGVARAAQVPLFESVSMTLDDGCHGLVGANGAGKTTLLSVLAGELVPTEGRVVTRGVIAYCRQNVDRLDDDIEALAQRDDGVAARLRGQLALGDVARWSTLSPGERKRWQVAAALAREPDVLLLDEPTNHLDTDAKKRLLAALRHFHGLCVVVSHDRSVLDTITTSTLRIHQRTVTLWPGSFSQARAQWEHQRARDELAHQAARERVKAAEAQLDAAHRSQAAATRGISAGRRMKNKNDSDARGIMATTKAQWAESKAGRSAASARTDLERARSAVPEIERDPTLGAKVFANYERAPNAVLFHLSADALRRGEQVVLRDVRVTVGREDRVRIEGENGAGKTTLLEALIGEPRERVLYLPQELAPQHVARTLARVQALAPDARGRLLSVYAALGSDAARVLGAATLSPGEARKLVLAEALSRQVWALVMDEPTNHMDLPSVERLEAALASYPGCIVLVTHDDMFASHTTTRSLTVADGSVR